jgi:hypothetical protein
MKKNFNLFLVSFALIFSEVTLAQNFSNLSKYTTTKNNVSNLTPLRQDVTNNDVEMRVVIFEETFQSDGPFPSDLISTWETNEVIQLDETSGNAFKLHNTSSANSGGYWPVAELGVNNVFAGANDDAVPCDCLMDEVYLETPSMDFSSVQNPAITFDIYHDGNFGGGDAWMQISTDGGSTWSMVNYNNDVNGVFPKLEGNWQTIVITLFEYSGTPDVKIRFTWSDAGSWSSGFAVDNVVVGDLENYSLTLDRTILGDWNSITFGGGYWDYTQIPLNQVDSVKVTGILSNTGLNSLVDPQMSVEIYQGNSLVHSDVTLTTSELNSLTKDTVSIITSYIPDNIGTYTINSLGISSEIESDSTDNSSSLSFEVTECTYARDLGSAQAFFQLESGDFAGNLFDIYQTEEYYGIQVALGAGTTVGSSIVGVIYLLTGFDETTGEPILEFVDGSETLDGEVLEEDLNGGSGNNFICLPFSSPVTLEPGNVYLVSVVASDVIRLPVSGNNSLPASWIYQDATGSYGWTQGIFMVRMVGECVECDLPSSVENNTKVDYSVSISPNPAMEKTTLYYNIKENDLILSVKDINGSLIENIKLPNSFSNVSTYELDLTKYSSGVYFYTIENQKYSISNKFIVE